jgi:hypothetical protein
VDETRQQLRKPSYYGDYTVYNLNVPAEDINLIVGAMQRRGQSSGVARDNTRGDADIGREGEPPRRDTISRGDRC